MPLAAKMGVKFSDNILIVLKVGSKLVKGKNTTPVSQTILLKNKNMLKIIPRTVVKYKTLI